MGGSRIAADERLPSFGALLRQYRQAAALTQEALAERAHLSSRGIADLERGVRRKPYPGTVSRLAEALHLSGEECAALTASASRARTGVVSTPTASALPASAAPKSWPASSRRGDTTRMHNLPAHLPNLIGREAELASLVELIERSDTALVTLIGAGGTGKTRLALAAGAALVNHFPDGVWLAELAPVSDPTLLANTVLASQGVPEQTGHTAYDQLVEVLTSRSVLLILDNCEHVVVGCAAFAASLLRDCDAVTILATSREPLRLPLEHTRRVSPLLFPNPAVKTPVQELIEYPAIQMFVDRAQVAVPTFHLDAANASAVAAICARLAGIPLAIELAAARVRVLGPEQILERLNDVFGLLVGGARSAPSRQQTMRATLNWSYELLSATEQQLFGRLAVFVGGWTLEAAEAVCQQSSWRVQDVLEALTGLIDKNLVQLHADAVSNTRFGMLEPIRQYAIERLVSNADLDAVRTRHAKYYQRLAETAEAELHGPNQGLWYERLETEHDNLWHAMSWWQTIARTPTIDATARTEALERGGRLANSLLSFWWVRGHVREGHEHIVALMAIGELGRQPELRSRFLATAGWMQVLLGHYDDALLHLQAAVDLADLTHDEATLAFAFSGLGAVARYRGSYASARAKHTASLELRRRLGNAHDIASSLEDIGVVAYLLGDLESASAAHDESLAICRRTGDRRGVGRVLGNMASVELRRGDLPRADALSRESLAIWLELGDRWAYASSLERFAGVAAVSGMPTRALRLAGAAAAIRAASATPLPPASQSELNAWLSPAWRELGEPAAQQTFAEGQAMSEEEAVHYAGAPIPSSDSLGRDSESNALTRREAEVAQLIAAGRSNRQIAEDLVIAVSTAERHVANILRKLDLTSRTQIATWFMKESNQVSHPVEALEP
jgi:non-specific serine/threonine protein kinase